MNDAGQPTTDTAEQPKETPSTAPAGGAVDRPSLPPPPDAGDQPGAAQPQPGADANIRDRPSLDQPAAGGASAEQAATQPTSGDTGTPTSDRPGLDRPAPSPGAPASVPEPIVTPLPPETGQATVESPPPPEPIVTPLPPETGQSPPESPAPEPIVTPLPPETSQSPPESPPAPEPIVTPLPPETGESLPDSGPAPESIVEVLPPEQVRPSAQENRIPEEIASITYPGEDRSAVQVEFDRPLTRDEAAKVLFKDSVPSGVTLQSQSDEGQPSTRWQVGGLSNSNYTELNGSLPQLVASSTVVASRTEADPSTQSDSHASQTDQTIPEPIGTSQPPTPSATDSDEAPSPSEPPKTAEAGRSEAKGDQQPEGAVRLQHPDGSVQQRDPDGTNTFESPGGSTISIHPNGAVVASPDVTLEATPDGGVRGTTKDGHTITASPQGDLRVQSPDGDTRGIDRDSCIRITTEDGTRETIAPDGTRLVQNPDNTTKTIYPDGSSKVLRYADGTTFPGGGVQWPEPGPLHPDGPPQDGINTYTDQAGNRWVVSDDGHQTIHTHAGTWERDPQGNITIHEYATGNTWHQGTDGSQRFTDGDGNLRHRTDPDGTRWVRDSSGDMVSAGRPHMEWTSPDGTVTVKEINGNYFRTSPEGREISLGGDRNWQKVSEDGFHGTVANSQHIQHVHETPHHPGQEGLAYSDALLGNFLAAADFGAKVVKTAAEWGALGPWGVAGAAIAGVLDAKSPGEAGLVLADAFMPGPPVGKHVPTGAGAGHVPTGGFTPHADVQAPHVDQPGPTGGGLGSTTPVRPDDARWGGAEVQAPSFSPQQAGVRESVGASPRGPDFQSASAQTERSIHTAIRPDLAETHSYKQLLTNGEIGLERPQGANVPGRPDSVTARENADGSITVFVNDAKGSKSGNFPEPAPHMPSTWRQQVENAVAPGRLDLGDPALEARIQQAVAQGNIELRQLNVDWSTPNVTVTDPVTGQRF